MSIIAKSLKRLKENRRPKFSVSGSKKSNGLFNNITLLYGLLIFLFISFAVVYSYITVNTAYKKVKKMEFPPISEIKHKLESEKRIAMNIQIQKNGLEDLLLLNKLDEMFKLAKQQNNIKYEGIYYFKKNNLDKAYNLFKIYLTKHKNDSNVKAYIAFIMYKKKMYKQSLHILNSINKAECNLILDKAIVNESLGKYQEALSLYRNASKICKNVAVSRKAIKKIIVLEYYLRNANES